MTIRPILGPISGLFLVGALSALGCSEAERTYDCAKICDKYATCIDDEIDRSECVDRCEDKGQDDPDFEEQADECQKCVSGEDCADATVECSTKCAWVIAEST